jgi:multidrug efflux pump subunit AcrA (membrane-fusion protein)
MPKPPNDLHMEVEGSPSYPRGTLVPSKVRIAATLGLLGLGLALSGCSKQPAPETEPVIPIQVAEARRATVERKITAEAILFPFTQSALMPKISAPVREIYVNRGDHVRRGQLLAVLENRDLAAAAAENRGLIKQPKQPTKARQPHPCLKR